MSLSKVDTASIMVIPKEPSDAVIIHQESLINSEGLSGSNFQTQNVASVKHETLL